jgi:two-component system response regulator RegA
MNGILIVDDDKTFCNVLKESLENRNHNVQIAHNIKDALYVTEKFNPQWILLDLKMPEGSGLELIPKLLTININIKIVVLTGYAGINTAIEAIKLGAIHYLSKPVSTEEIIAAFDKNEGNPDTPVELVTIPLDLAEREYILAILNKNNQNISATARELGMHRRTLQRKLDKIR